MAFVGLQLVVAIASAGGLVVATASVGAAIADGSSWVVSGSASGCFATLAAGAASGTGFSGSFEVRTLLNRQPTPQ